jgi:hypothetical protein
MKRFEAGPIPNYFDPFGAPEHLIDGFVREMICTELVRLTCLATEGRDRIVRVKLLIPVPVLVAERAATATFLTEQLAATDGLRRLMM